MPPNFSWIERPGLAAHAFPDSPDDLLRLRKEGVQIVITLTEDPLPRRWINDAGLMAVHIPVEDLSPPTEFQLELAVQTIQRAKRSGFGAAIHCQAGLGRTGTVIAAYLVSQGLTARGAIDQIRKLRPGSIETSEQERAVVDWANRVREDGVD